MTVLLAQLVGLLGFVLMLLATQQPTRQRLLALDVAGILLVSLHWLLLGEAVGAAYNSVFVAISGLGLLSTRSRVAQRVYWLLYPLVLGLATQVADVVDALAAVGTLLAVVGVQQRDLRRLRVLVAISGSVWLVYGVLTRSVGQVLFGVLFVAGHLRMLRRGPEVTSAPVTRLAVRGESEGG